MKNVSLFLVSIVLACSWALAQDFPRAEVYGGYSYLNIDTNNLSPRQSANGWEASVAGNFTKWFAAEADVSGYYKNYSVDLTSLGLGTLNVKVTDYSYAGGPRINLRPAFIHALFGGDHLTGSALGFSRSQNGFAGLAGGGVQWKVSNHLSVRASADYVFTRHNIFGGSALTQDNFRAGVGLVYSFGRTGPADTTPRPERSSSARTKPTTSEPRSSGSTTGGNERTQPKTYPAGSRSGIPIPVLGLVASAREGGGAEIKEVAPGSVASYAGFNSGDVINSIDGKTVSSPTELAAELSNRVPGEKVRIGYLVHGYWQTETTISLPSKP
jgi:Outer membrane protein beta-barrel domain/PDZ domain